MQSSPLALCALSFLAFLALKFCDKRLIFVFGILIAVYVAADDCVTGLGWTTFRFIHAGCWNWSGKIRSLATGLVLPRRNVRIGAIALVPLILLWCWDLCTNPTRLRPRRSHFSC